MTDQNKKFGIIGLGLLGGSYAKGLHEAGCAVKGTDTDEKACAYALERGWVSEASADPRILADCDIVISALYPKAFVNWVSVSQDILKPGCLLSDVSGVKRYVIEEVNRILRKDVEFIAVHPMAGREFRGISYADSDRFKAANYIVVPTGNNSEYAVETAKEIGRILGFRNIVTLSAERHDEMIGYLSQLTHVIAVSLMNANDRTDLCEYTGDSFRDLTRIAFINEELWPELFVLNKDNLVREIDDFVSEMNVFRTMIEEEDYEGMKQRLRQSSERRLAFTKKENSQ